MKFEDLTPEQREKAKACKSREEFLAMAQEEGLELSEDELDAVDGGVWWRMLGLQEIPNRS